jgi:hypothetical protein
MRMPSLHYALLLMRIESSTWDAVREVPNQAPTRRLHNV